MNLRFTKHPRRARADVGSAHPGFRIALGVFLVLVSFLLGWPAVAGLGALASLLDKPWIAAVGGPLVYGLSCVLLVWGAHLAGTRCQGRLRRLFVRNRRKQAALRREENGADGPGNRTLTGAGKSER